MYSRVQLAYRYFLYFMKASNGKGHGMHSPFVFDFIVHVLKGKKRDKIGFNKIETMRSTWKKSNAEIEVHDLGAGSGLDNKSYRQVSSIAKYAAKPKKYGQLLYRIATYYHIESILELGTSLGLTTQYLALSNPTSGVITIEGAPAIAEFAKEAFAQSGLKGISLEVGDFSAKIDGALQNMKGRKLIFFDGNHQYQSTIDYFNAAIKFCSNEDILIFDDIHWSKGMEKAWKEIQSSEQVSCTIDLFFIGIVFFRKEFKEKLDFIIRF